MDQLDQVGRLVVVELVPLNQAELDGGCGHALLEVEAVEGEAMLEELDLEIVSGRVVRFERHGPEDENTPG